MLLQFGVPSLDDLIEPPVKRMPECPSAESVAILGPDGSGKSVFSLHLASRYAADCARYIEHELSRRGKALEECPDLGHPPCILYISSDLRKASADKIWENFGLEKPNRRQIPFERSSEVIKRWQSKHIETLALKEFSPEDTDKIVDYFLGKPTNTKQEIAFLDLASHTAGDDWKFVNSILVKLQAVESAKVVLTAKQKNEPISLPHLVIIDSVEGFETFVGRLDSYGNEQTRRARVAQCVRNAGNRVHLIFVVEEPNSGEHLAEEYVTDVVLRMRDKRSMGASHLTIQVQKARSREHAKGEHPFEIRDRNGTSTGSWENADTPRINNAYVQVLFSIAHRNRVIAAEQGLGIVNPNVSVASFGLTYLDQLLWQHKPGGGSPKYGLRAGTATALIGDSSTGKSILGIKFLAQGFEQLVEQVICLSAIQGKKYNDINEHCKQTYAEILDNLSQSVFSKQGAGGPSSTAGWHEEDWKGPINAAIKIGQDRTKQEFADICKTDATDSARQSLRFEAILKQSADWSIRTEANQMVLPEEQTPVPKPQDRQSKSRARLTLNAGNIKSPEIEVAIPELFRHPNLASPGILLTTTDRRGTKVAVDCCKLLATTIQSQMKKFGMPDSDKPKVNSVIEKILDAQLIVRRFEMQALPAAAVFHIIQRNVTEAEKAIFGVAYPSSIDRRYWKSGRIRVVIDDFRVLSKVNPEIVEDGAFLPFLTFYLEREGVVSLLVHTDSVRPSTIPTDETSRSLQSIVKHVILTWNVPFEGRSRIAISVLPHQAPENNGVVRELTIDYDSPAVTRKFELYSGIEDGKPASVPLAVYIFRETSGFAEYVDEEDKVFREIFTSVEHANAVSPGRVIYAIDAERYQALRDYTHLSLDAQDSHSMVFQVDGYWAQGGTHILDDMTDYMFTKLEPRLELPTSQQILQRMHQPYPEDPFRLFTGKGGATTRSEYFNNSCYTYRKTKGEATDRVPFMWDFGFLLTRSAAFDAARDAPLRAASFSDDIAPFLLDVVPGAGETVKHIYDAMQSRQSVSWRRFLGACKLVAEVHHQHAGELATPFDVASQSSDTLNSLLLEMWLSEIEIEATILNHEWKSRIQKKLKASDFSLLDLLRPDRQAKPDAIRAAFRSFLYSFKRDALWDDRCKQFKELPLAAFCLYKVWLLLLEVLNFEEYLHPERPFSFRLEHSSSLHAVASRHWYKTACVHSNNFYNGDGTHNSLVALRLPGRYSTRGDWFLGSPKSSRSKLLAQHTIDLLSSRRANLTRLQRGLGLPVRDVVDDNVCSRLNTALRCKVDPTSGFRTVSEETGLKPFSSELKYGELAMLGAVEGSDVFHWLHRSDIRDYDRMSRPLHQWMARLFRWTCDYRKRHAHRWSGGFPGYDDLTLKKIDEIRVYESFVEFGELCDLLIAELSAAERESS